jgi:hypothetical protein
MKPATLELLLKYIDEAIRLNGHSHHGTSPWAHEVDVPAKEIEALKRELRDAIYNAERGEVYDGTYTHIIGE